MTTPYVLTALAEADLDDTWDYVAEKFGFLPRIRISGICARTSRRAPIRSGRSARRSLPFGPMFGPFRSFASFEAAAGGRGFFRSCQYK